MNRCLLCCSHAQPEGVWEQSQQVKGAAPSTFLKAGPKAGRCFLVFKDGRKFKEKVCLKRDRYRKSLGMSGCFCRDEVSVSVKKHSRLPNKIQTVVVRSARQELARSIRECGLGLRPAYTSTLGALGRPLPLRPDCQSPHQDRQGGWEVESLFTEDLCSADTQGSAVHRRRREWV